MAAKLPTIRVEPLTHDEKLLLAPFEQWANQRGVRWLPAKGSTISSYALEVAHRGDAFVLETIAAIERAHFAAGLASATTTPIVRHVLDKIVTVEPPRSWPKEDKAMFATLPPQIKSIIARRESNRDSGTRKAQNRAAEATKRHNDEAAQKIIVETKKREN